MSGLCIACHFSAWLLPEYLVAATVRFARGHFRHANLGFKVKIAGPIILRLGPVILDPTTDARASRFAQREFLSPK